MNVHVVKKVLAVVAAVAMLAFTGCNMQIIDTSWRYNVAYINGISSGWKRVEISSWKDITSSDMLQIKTKDGKTYLSHSANIILAAE